MTIINQVYETKDYDAFVYRKDNRTIEENKKLKEEISKLGIISPILVNEKLEVIDGQNRIDLAKQLNKPVPFIILNGAGHTQIVS